MKLELVGVPVTDVDRAKEFYLKVGFNADHDHKVSDEIRFVQMTPPGSACSIAFGNGLTQMAPGSLDNLQMVVADAAAVVEPGSSAAILLFENRWAMPFTQALRRGGAEVVAAGYVPLDALVASLDAIE